MFVMVGDEAMSEELMIFSNMTESDWVSYHAGALDLPQSRLSLIDTPSPRPEARFAGFIPHKVLHR